VLDHHRYLLKQLLEHKRFIEQQVAEVEPQIEWQVQPFQEQIELLRTIPGIEKVTAWSLIAEIGVKHGAVCLGATRGLLGGTVSGQP
jgi:transposase